MTVMVRASDQAHAAILAHAGELERAAGRRVTLTDALDDLLRSGTPVLRENATQGVKS